MINLEGIHQPMFRSNSDWIFQNNNEFGMNLYENSVRQSQATQENYEQEILHRMNSEGGHQPMFRSNSDWILQSNEGYGMNLHENSENPFRQPQATQENYDQEIFHSINQGNISQQSTEETAAANQWNFFDRFQQTNMILDPNYANSSRAANDGNLQSSGKIYANVEFYGQNNQMMAEQDFAPIEPTHEKVSQTFQAAEPESIPTVGAYEQIASSAPLQQAEALNSGESLNEIPSVADPERVRSAVFALCQRFPVANAEELSAMLSAVSDAEFPKILAVARDSLKAAEIAISRSDAKSARFVDRNEVEILSERNLIKNRNESEAVAWNSPKRDEIEVAERIYEMFPQADPQYIFAELGRGLGAENLIDRMMRGGYPKEKDRLEKERNRRRREELMDPLLFEIDDFLLTFDHPEQFFTNRQRVVSQIYIE